jgi:histidinol-phosphate phosphatase family protein
MSCFSKTAIFLDRDGVLNQKRPEGGYVKKFAEFHWNRGAKRLIKRINQLGFPVVVISNQQGIALGKISREFVERLHRRMNRDLERIGARIDAFYFCPHLRGTCSCRKPEPGMLLQAATDLGICLKNSFMVGDSESDILAGKKAGCRTILIEKDQVDVKKIIDTILET